MNLHQIKYFIALVDTKNFSRAAERMHVTQSTLSAGIRKLEEELGKRLFERTTKDVQITSEGEKFLGHAKVIFSEMNKIQEEAQDPKEPRLLRIGLLKTLPMDPIVKAIHDFREQNTDTIVTIVDDDDETIRHQLERERIDLGITTITNDDFSLQSKLLFEEELMIAVNRSSDLSKMESVELTILDKQPFIERINCDRWDDMHQKFNEKHIHPRSVFWAESDPPVLSMVGIGMGLSIMPPRPNTNGVVFIPIKGEKVMRRVGLIWKKDREAQLTNKFCNYAQELEWPLRCDVE